MRIYENETFTFVVGHAWRTFCKQILKLEKSTSKGNGGTLYTYLASVYVYISSVKDQKCSQAQNRFIQNRIWKYYYQLKFYGIMSHFYVLYGFKY